MEETANINAEVDTSVSDSSSDQEVDMDNMSEEQLREELAKEREAKQEAIRHMREQERKRKAQAEQPQEPKQTEDNQDVESVARKIVQSELRKQTIESVSKGSDTWLKQQDFAKDLFGESDTSDRLYARVKAQAQMLADEEGVTTSEQYLSVLRRAHAAITGKADALVGNESVEQFISQDKSQSAGYRGSQAPQPSPSYSGFSQADMVLIERINDRRAKFGKKPFKPGEILKK